MVRTPGGSAADRALLELIRSHGAETNAATLERLRQQGLGPRPPKHGAPYPPGAELIYAATVARSGSGRSYDDVTIELAVYDGIGVPRYDDLVQKLWDQVSESMPAMPKSSMDSDSFTEEMQDEVFDQLEQYANVLRRDGVDLGVLVDGDLPTMRGAKLSAAEAGESLLTQLVNLLSGGNLYAPEILGIAAGLPENFALAELFKRSSGVIGGLLGLRSAVAANQVRSRKEITFV